MDGVMYLCVTRQKGIVWAVYDVPVCVCVCVLAVSKAPDYAELIKQAHNCLTADPVVGAKM